MKTILLILLSVVLAAMTWGVMFVTDVQRDIFQNSYVEQILDTLPVAEFAGTALSQQLFSDLPQGIPPVVKQELPKAFITVFNQPWFDRQLRIISSDLISTIKGEKNSLTTVIDIRKEKEQMFEQLMVQLSALSDRELAEGGLPRMALGFASSALREQILAGIPNEFSLDQLLQDAGLPVSAAEMQKEYLQARRNYRTGLIILIPLLMIGFLLLSGVTGLFRWAGWTLIISGALYLGGLLILRGMAPAVLLESGIQGFAQPSDLAQAVKLTVDKFIFLPMAVSAGGVILVALSIFLPRRNTWG